MPRSIWIFVVPFLIFTAGCSPRSKVDDQRFQIAVVGQGLRNECTDENVPNDACAVLSGVLQAVKFDEFASLRSSRPLADEQNNPTQPVLERRTDQVHTGYDFRHKYKYFEIAAYDDEDLATPHTDEGRNRHAADIAWQLQSNPAVLSVIGHSASSTTRVAEPFYSQAGIPLLIPVATSPSTKHPPRQDRWLSPALFDKNNSPETTFNNYFRLIPDDAYMQAPSIAYVAKKLLKDEGNPVVIGDYTENVDYVRDLYNEVTRLLATPDGLKFWTNATGISHATSTIRNAGTKVIVFIGTAERALNLLKTLHSDAPATGDLDVILSDGAKDIRIPPNELPSSTRVYITFPALPLPSSADCQQHADPKAKKICELLRGAKKKQVTESYEVYGFDAMLMINEAIRACRLNKLPLTRRMLQEQLSMRKIHRGPISNYLFVAGENVQPIYSLYGASVGPPPQVAATSPGTRQRLCRSAFGTIDLPKTDQNPMSIQFFCKIEFDDIIDLVDAAESARDSHNLTAARTKVLQVLP